MRRASIAAFHIAIACFAGSAFAAPGDAEINLKYTEKGQHLGGGCAAITDAPGGGRVMVCNGGAIYWSSSYGAHEIHGSIYQKYVALKSSGLNLAYPTTDEEDVQDGRGRYSVFQHGVIYWTPQTGAHEVHGAILTKWSELGAPYGLLGYPKTDELVASDPQNVGRFNHFEHGSIYWSPASGAHEVHGAIFERWAQLAWEQGPLGFPTSDEYTVPCTGERRSIFQGGDITWLPSVGAHETFNHFWDIGMADWCWERSGGSIVFKPIVANCGTLDFNEHVATTTRITLDGLQWSDSGSGTVSLSPGEETRLDTGALSVDYYNSPWLYYNLNFDLATVREWPSMQFPHFPTNPNINSDNSATYIQSPVTGAYIVGIETGNECRWW